MIASSIKDPAGANIPAEATDVHNPMCNVLPVNGLGTAWLKKNDVKLNGTIIFFDGRIPYTMPHHTPYTMSHNTPYTMSQNTSKDLAINA